MVKLTINGKDIQAQPGKTVLDVVKEQNIAEIPTFCANQQLDPFSSCFICVIEIEGARSLRPSCATTVAEGMKIKTDSERIALSRKANLELLLSNHRADCYPPCKLACPANIDIQGYIALNSRGLHMEGHRLIKEMNPLSMACGRICAKPCEDSCRRNHVDEPLDIKNIKRYMSDIDLKQNEIYTPEPGRDTGKKVAVIGAGPAGVSAAYYLRIKGHAVNIFEKLPNAGGMMRYGIPEYRLPKKDMQKEIDSILSMGVEIKYNTELGKDITIDSLFKSGFDSIFLGTGAQLGSKMGVKGDTLQNVMQGVDFLRDVGLGREIKLSGKVFVVGGGNTAIDAARSSLRLGADSVTIVYRRTEEEMPAHHEEIEDAKEEGINISILTNPVEYSGENGRLSSIRLQKMKLGEKDASGRRSPVPVEGSEYDEKADFVIEAIGQAIDRSGLDGIEFTRKGTIAADEKLFTTSRKGVFAGGDAVSGPYIVIGAVAHGRKAAHVIDQFLKGEELKPENMLGFHIRKEDFGEIEPSEFASIPKEPRRHIQKLSAEERKKSFVEVEKGFTAGDVSKESARCLECGCQDIYECKLKEYSEKFGADKSKFIAGEHKGAEYNSKNRFIAINTEKCINCGQCVRICDEVQKQAVFSFDKRGFKTVPVPYAYKPLDETNCIECGLCVSACPVGAIVEKLPLGKPGPFKNSVTETHCNLCGDVCRIAVESHEGNFVKISSKLNNETFLDNLCKKGRFGYEKTISQNAHVSGGFSAMIVDQLSGMNPDATIMDISPYLTVEEIDMAERFATQRNISIFSFEIWKDYEKYQELKNITESVSADISDISGFKNIFYFGGIDEESNSVSFRKLVKNDEVQSIHISADLKQTYFKHKKYSSDDEMISVLKEDPENSIVVFNLRNTSVDTIKKIAEFTKTENHKGILILNSMPNVSHLMKKIDFEKISESIKKHAFENLIALNSDEDSISSKFRHIVYFSDREVKMKPNHFVRINSIYEKRGTIIDQSGKSKKLNSILDFNGYTLEDFLA